MKNKKNRSWFTVFWMLILTTALLLAGCGKKTEAPAEEKSFTFVVTDEEGTETEFSITTSCATVGEALEAEKLIEGEQGDYGLYVKTVNGITADFEETGTYWAFYIDGEYALTSVDQTEITDGAVYMFKIEQ